MRIGLLIVITVFMISVAHAASLGATLTVAPEIQTSLIPTILNPSPKINEYITIIADYEDTNGTDVQNATVKIQVEGKMYNMTYVPSASAYSFEYVFSEYGTYFFYITAEKGGYEKQEKVISMSISKTKSRLIGSAPTPKIDVIVRGENSNHSPVLSGENISISFDLPDMNFQHLIINAVQPINYGTMNMSDCNPSLTEENIVYDCISIKLKNILPIQYGMAHLYFRVSKQWIDNNNINASTISILKISNETTSTLTITQNGEDENYYYFYTNFSEFSNFVVYAQQNTVYCGDNICNNNESCETCSQDCGVCGEITILPIIENCTNGSCVIMSVCWFGAIVVVIIAGISYYLLCQKKVLSPQKKERAPKFKNKKLKLKNLNQKARKLEKEIRDIKKKLKKKESRELRKKFGKKLKELNKIHEKIEDYKNEIVELEHKHKIKPKIKKRK